MRLSPTPLAGLMLVASQEMADERGSFARLYCRDALADQGVDFPMRQASLSRSTRRGTLRGLHWSAGEGKLVRCVAGAIFDVAVDLRPGSPTRHRWFTAELSAANGLGMLVPAGFAHGLLTLTDEAAVLYQMDRDHAPEAARGARWDDPAFAIAWPFAPRVLSAADATWPPVPPA